jgi:hypothetical protein
MCSAAIACSGDGRIVPGDWLVHAGVPQPLIILLIMKLLALSSGAGLHAHEACPCHGCWESSKCRAEGVLFGQQLQYIEKTCNATARVLIPSAVCTLWSCTQHGCLANSNELVPGGGMRLQGRCGLPPAQPTCMMPT